VELRLPPGLPEHVARAALEARALDGTILQHELYAIGDEHPGVFICEAAAGTYWLRWYESATVLGRRRLRILVNAGMVTRVDGRRPAEPGEDAVAPGLGRLDVFVRDVDGGPMSAAKVLLLGSAFEDGDNKVESFTDPQGVCRFELLPGCHRLEIGRRTMKVDVHEGESRQVEIAYREEGELVVATPLDGITLRLRGEQLWSVRPEEQVHRGGGYRFRFLSEGVYEIGWMHGRRIAGEAIVRRGERTEFRCEVPTCSISARVRFPAGIDAQQQVHLAMEITGLGEGALPRVDEDWRVAPGAAREVHLHVMALAAGRYLVRVKAAGFSPAERQVLVTKGSEACTLDLAGG